MSLLDDYDVSSGYSFLIIGFITLLLYIFVINPWIKDKTAPKNPLSVEFYTYIRRWLNTITVFAMLIFGIFGIMLYYDLTWEKITLWLGGGAAILAVVLLKFPEAENAMAAMTVFWRNQVHPNQEFEITYLNGDTEQLTLVKRNELFSYAQKFSGSRGVKQIPHTKWVESTVVNLSEGPVRWVLRIPLRFNMALRNDILDAVDEFVLDSGFSDLPVDSVKYNYMTKIVPEVYGHFPEQVLIVYTMITSREYGHEEENGFLDGLYKVLSDINGVEVACGETSGGTPQ